MGIPARSQAPGMGEGPGTSPAESGALINYSIISIGYA